MGLSVSRASSTLGDADLLSLVGIAVKILVWLLFLLLRSTWSLIEEIRGQEPTAMTNLEGGLPESLREGSGAESDLAVPATVLPSTTAVDMERSEMQSKGIDTSLHAFQGVREAPLATSTNVKIPFDYATGAQRGDVNMEAPISNDDLMHAGGFDARDDLDSMVPSAADGTDYEELLTEAMDYEDTGEADSYPDSRPGVGATDKQIHIRGGSMIAKSRSGKMEGL